jgi:hypothetical protein
MNFKVLGAGKFLAAEGIVSYWHKTDVDACSGKLTRTLFSLARMRRLGLATSAVTGLSHLPYPNEFQGLTPERKSLRYILGIAFGVRPLLSG